VIGGKIAELETFHAELARVADRLGLRSSDGACNDDCGCLTDGHTNPDVAVSVTSRGRIPQPMVPPIVCTLDTAEMPGRLGQWQRLAEHVVEHTDTDHGIRVRFDDRVSAVEVADLATKEQGCCSFFAFTMHIAADGITLDIAAPAEARELVETLFNQH
jgi:hypothetical protein